MDEVVSWGLWMVMIYHPTVHTQDFPESGAFKLNCERLPRVVGDKNCTLYTR